MDKHQRSARPAPPSPPERARMLRKAFSGHLSRARRKLGKQEAEVAEAQRFEWLRRMGDSLLAEPASAPRGTHVTTIRDVHSGRPESVKLNPALDARGNAELFYRRARKAQRGLEIAERKTAETREELSALEELHRRATALIERGETAESFEQDLLLLEREAQERGIGTGRQSRAAPAPPREPFKRFRIDQWEVLVGRSARDNDELTLHVARPHHLWLHVAAHQGSHVVIPRARNADRPPKRVVEKAAALAAWFSRARHSSFVEVHVTEARFVRKPRKSPPGSVVAQRCTSVRVAPRSPKELFYDSH